MKILLITGILFGMIAGSELKGQTIDTQNSKVIFEAIALKKKQTEGSFTGMEGTVKFNPGDLANSAFKVCIDASSLNSGLKMRDKHLRSDDFFYVEKYPDICFVSESIEKRGDEFITKGNLTIREVSKAIEIPFSFEANTLEGSIVINRFDYNLGNDVKTSKASEEASITIICKLMY